MRQRRCLGLELVRVTCGAWNGTDGMRLSYTRHAAAELRSDFPGEICREVYL